MFIVFYAVPHFLRNTLRVLLIATCTILLICSAILAVGPYAKWLGGEVTLLKAEWQMSKESWANFYLIRFIALKIFMLVGFAYLFKKAGYYVTKKANESGLKNYLFASIMLLFFHLLLTSVLYIADKFYGTFPGPYNNILSYAVAPPLVVNQMYGSDSLGMNYLINQHLHADRRINEQGFTSPFNYTPAIVDSLRKQGKKIVFVIGDSFTEGVSPTNYDSTFIQRIIANDTGLALLPFGVGGADPLNYKLIADKYIPLLKPDLVIIAFCWNDIMKYDRIASPNIPLFYQTNIGWLQSNIPFSICGNHNQILPTPQAAYNYYKDYLFINPNENVVAKLCSKSSFSARVYTKIRNIKTYKDTEEKETISKVSHRYLKDIQETCKLQGAAFSIAFIPDINKTNEIKTQQDNEQAYREVFHELLPQVRFINNSITAADYISLHNQHFNDAGNAKFALFLDSLIHQGLKQ